MKVRPYVKKQKRVRDPMSVKEKLAITLRFLQLMKVIKVFDTNFELVIVQYHCLLGLSVTPYVMC